MAQKYLELTRQQLYDEVWSTPMIKLCKRYGLSDSGLAKVCRRCRIPRPPRGYWQERRAGKPVKRVPLPPLREGEKEIMLHFPVPEEDDIDQDQVVRADELLGMLHDYMRRARSIGEPEPHHPLVEAAARSLGHGRVDSAGILRPRSRRRLDIRVSRSGLERAVGLVDELIKILEACGCAVSVGEDGQTRADVLGQAIPFHIAEDIESRTLPLTSKQQRHLERHPYAAPQRRYEHIPTGRLALRIGQIKAPGTRRQWGDLKNRPLEDRLETVVRALARAAITMRSEVLKEERRRQEWDQRRRAWAEEEQRRREETERIARLDKQLAAWQRSRLMRDFVLCARKQLGGSEQAGTLSPEAAIWLKWVEKHADRLDRHWRLLCSMSEPNSGDG